MIRKIQEKASSNFLNKESSLSHYATKNEKAIRLVDRGESNDIRPHFYHDIDRIIHSLSYTRYLDKTQVYSFLQNDHITKRIIHVQLVSKIARTLARALNLNEDLAEAIALGHDIGHTPIGHTGEAILNKISLRELGENFGHNFQSVRTYLELENKGNGINLTVQVLDGIMCHNGEMLESVYSPKEKTVEEFLYEYKNSYTNLELAKKIRPMTIEGCLVRISDLIGYLGRDLEDALLLGKIKREELPEAISNILGNNNKDIVNTIIEDIIVNSLDKPYIKMSDSIFRAMKDLKKFNYKEIYNKANTENEIQMLTIKFEYLYSTYINDLKIGKQDSEIYISFLNSKDEKYIINNSHPRIVLDFLAGMTDEYLMECYQARK